MARLRDDLEIADPPLKSQDKGGWKISLCCYLMSVTMSIFVTLLITLGLFSDCMIGHKISLNDDVDLQASFSEFSKKKIDVRLPKHILPDTYELKIIPFFWDRNFTFDGEVNILLNVTETTREIVLHAGDLYIHEKLTKVEEYAGENLSGKRLKVLRHVNDTAKQFLIVYVGEDLLAGKQYKLYLNFKGHLNDDLRGFYRSSYTIGNETRWIGATQFQPTDARRAFPCFDEPAMKAKFQISIARPKNMTSISNMPKISEKETDSNLNNYVWDVFEKSVPMSTYLVAYLVSDFDQVQSPDGKLKIWTRAEALNQTSYSLEIGPKILKYYEDFFQIDFPLPKIDMVALPDFAAGAMENWGLITYRETALLYQDGISTNDNKQRVATVVAHELAHQWFGNLVTPSWWTDLWLNEGFASYLENLGMHAVEPDWQALDQFIVHELQSVFLMDSLESSHPVSIPVGHPDEINEIFDRISYAKGASIIRMMDHYLTTDVFKRGLTNYLNKLAYESAEQDDLWDSLTKQAHKDKALEANVSVKQIMDTWTLQTGFPFITVVRDYAKDSAKITQDRFTLRNTRNLTSVLKKPLWWIPISYTTSERSDFQNTHPSLWMKAQSSVSIPQLGASADQWVIFNIQETGYYRVNYDKENWQLISKQLRGSDYERILTANRAQLVDDALNLARAGHIDYGVSLDVISYLKQEKEHLPWKSALTNLDFMDKMLIRGQGYDLFRDFILNLIENVYNQVGFLDNPNDPQLTVFTRYDVLAWACRLGHEDCVQKAIGHYSNWQNMTDPDSRNPIPPNLKSVVYCTAIRNGGVKEWDFAWQRYRKTNVASEKDLLLYALGCTRETWLLTRYLDWTMVENSDIRKQDVYRAVGAVSNSAIGQPIAFNYFITKWSQIRKNFGSSQSIISHIVKSFTRRINTKRQLQELIDFTKKHMKELGSATRAITQVVEQAQSNIEWLQRNHGTITTWLKTARS